MTQMIDRRRFLRNAGLLGAGIAAGGLAAPHIARAATATFTIVSNPGLENATLNILMQQQGYFARYGVNARITEAPGASGPFDLIASGGADVCMVSGFNMVLPRIAQGAKVKIVGAGMRKTALTVFTRPDGITSLRDLVGRTVAVGARGGLLDALMRQLLKEQGIDESQVNFVDKGSNDQCYRAVVAGEADACCTSISHLNDADGLVVVQAGNMWQALPDYTFQTAYASHAAISTRHAELVATMQAYGMLFDFLMKPGAHDAFFAARKAAQKTYDAPSAQAIWDFNQAERPYTRDLTLSDADIGYLQDMFIGLGSLTARQPLDQVTDMTAAKEAASRLA